MNNLNIHQLTMDKQDVAYHTNEYYSVIKRTEVLVHTTTWLNLENIMLTEKSQTKESTYCVIPVT